MAEITNIYELKMKQQMKLTLMLENERAQLHLLYEDAAFFKGLAEQKGKSAVLLHEMAWDIEDEARAMHGQVDDALTYGPVKAELLEASRSLRQALEPRLKKIQELIKNK